MVSENPLPLLYIPSWEVLILVLVEDGLGALSNTAWEILCPPVLILVLVEDGLGDFIVCSIWTSFSES